MSTPTLERDHVVDRLRENEVLLPRFDELADPTRIPGRVRDALAAIDPDAPHPLNLFRVHWHNDTSRRGFAPVPEHVVLTRELTGVDAPIVVALGDRFPMIGAHKVLAAYGCLVPRLVAGEFDPTTQRAIWPSTGNYCRGGVAISQLLGCRGVAVLPEGMSQERFDWLARWVVDPEDVIRTPGTESNVKEIYDQCHELELDDGERDPQPVLGVREPHRPLPGDRRGARRVFESPTRNRPRSAAPLVRLCDRLGRNDRRRRLPEGAARLAGRRGRGRRVPDDARERLRRAQHPGDRRQAHPADPQRDEHRRRGGGLGSRDRPRRPALRQRRRPRAPAAQARRRGACSTRCPRSGFRASATSSPRSRSRSSSDLGAERRRSSRWRPTARRCTTASAASPRRGTSPTGSTRSAPSEIFGEHLLGAATDLLRELTYEERTRIFNLGLLHLGRAAGRSARRRSRRADGRRSGRRSARSAADWDELIGEVNERTGVLERCEGRRRRRSSVPAAARRCRPTSRTRSAARTPEGRRRPRPAAHARPERRRTWPRMATSPSPFVRFRRLLHPTGSGCAGGLSDDELRALDRAARRADRRASTDTGFRTTPFARADELSDALGFSARGGVWIKDETGGVVGLAQGAAPLRRAAAARGGRAARLDRRSSSPRRSRSRAAATPRSPPAVVAAAASRRLRCSCRRTPSRLCSSASARSARGSPSASGTPASLGDPTVARLRHAIADGALPFTCQGDLNGLAIEGGHTLGWELAASRRRARPHRRPGRRRCTRERRRGRA